MTLTRSAAARISISRQLIPRVTQFSTGAAPSDPPASRDTQSLSLPDGRVLGYAEYGSPSGLPLLFFHGYPGSRLEAYGTSTVAHRLGLRVICPDRPGFGISTPQHGRRIVDWPADVAALMDGLGLETAAVLVGSGGGPYALACAVKDAPTRDRLSAVGVIAGAKPPWTAGLHDMPRISRVSAALADRWPGVLRATFAGSVGLGRWAMGTKPVVRRMDAMLAQGPGSAPWEPPGHQSSAPREQFVRMVFEGFAQGPDAAVHEAHLLSTDWGFDFKDVTFDPVRMWHGITDPRAPIRMIRWMAEQMPHAVLCEFDSGHFDMGKHLDGILVELCGLKSGQANTPQTTEGARSTV